MEENTVLAALGPAINALRTLALVALDMEEAHPLALPEPPDADKVAAYEQRMTAIAQQVAPRHRALLDASLRDYRAGFPDRAGTYLLELATQLRQDSEYATAFSPAAQKRLQGYVMDLQAL